MKNEQELMQYLSDMDQLAYVRPLILDDGDGKGCVLWRSTTEPDCVSPLQQTEAWDFANVPLTGKMLHGEVRAATLLQNSIHSLLTGRED